MTENNKEMTSDKAENKVQPQNVTCVKIVLPNNEILDLQVDSLELIQEIHFILADREETCHRTCFSLKIDGKVLDNFAELKQIPELVENVEIIVSEEPYNVREAKFHVKHIHDLLRSVEYNDAYLGRDLMSLSFVSTITDSVYAESKIPGAGESIDGNPPDYLVPVIFSNGNSVTSSHLLGPSIAALHPIDASTDSKATQCLQTFNYSNWNPPPTQRMLHGDLVYLFVHTMEDKRLHITGCTKGFYVNQSTDQIFNPKPASHPYLSHSLVDLLKQVSSIFKRNYDTLLKKRSNRHAFERIPAPFQVYSWLSPNIEHGLDSIRKEEAFCSKMAYEEHLPGQTRDWNEEMQNTRDMPREKLPERINREKAIFKTNTDFVAAASRAAINVLRGNIMAINPGEHRKQQMFIWNNIFFALGFDIKDHYKDFGGDAAAYAANMNDLNGVRALSSLDVPGLCTLGTAVIDYAGYRVTAQTLIPGILEREHEESVVYGSYDFGKTVVEHEKYTELFERPANDLKIMPHTVTSCDGKEVELKSSIECKGIIGSDKRHYVLDLLFTSPPDVHYLGTDPNNNEEDKREAGLIMLKPSDLSQDMVALGYPIHHRHQLSVLRQELLDAYCEFRYLEFLHKVKASIEEAKVSNNTKKKKDTKTEENSDTMNSGENNGENIIDDLKKFVDEPIESGYDEEMVKKIVAKCAESVGSLSDSKVVIKFNPDAYQKGITVPESEKPKLEKDRQLLKDVCEFLVKVQIPQLIKDCLDEVTTPQDGRSLIDSMHQKGINVRYLNRLVETIPNTPSLSWLKSLAVSEILQRSIKHIYKIYIQQVDPMNMSASIAHFLNCFLSSCSNPVPCMSAEEVTKMNKNSRKNKKNKTKSTFKDAFDVWTSETPVSLWNKLKEEALDYYHYDINCTDIETFCQTFNVSRATLLRGFCTSNGVQILLRDYVFDQRNRATFLDEDIINLFPIVSHQSPQASDAYKLFGSGQSYVTCGKVGQGRELISEALSLLSQVYGPLHADIGACNRLLAHLSYMLAEHQNALMFQYRATVIAERVYGIDSSNVIQEYCHLGLYSFACNQVNVALNCLYRARHIALICHGDIHPEMPNIDANIGIMLIAKQNYDKAVQFMENSLETSKIFYGAKSLKVATAYHLIARIYSYKGDFRSAVAAEKQCFNIYSEKLGVDNERTKECHSRLNSWTSQAVNVARLLAELSLGDGSTSNQSAPLSVAASLQHQHQQQQQFLHAQQPNMLGLLETLNAVNGLCFIRFNDEELEKLKQEINGKLDDSDILKMNMLNQKGDKPSNLEDTATPIMSVGQ